jgi:hypothetical protein
MALRQRKGKSTKAGKKSSEQDKDDKKKQKPKQKQNLQPKPKTNLRKATGKQVLLFMSFVLGSSGLLLYHFYTLYGPAIFLGSGWKDFKIEPYEWRRYLDTHDKTILLIGGPHRSGTTIVWSAISSHPDAVGFGGTFETGADFSEGILFQDVYPAFGVGMEFNKNFASAGIKKKVGEDKIEVSSGGGLGQYALLPESHVHWTKENHHGKLDDPKTLSKLMNRFAPHWDSNKKYGREEGLKKAKVWIEKSPQNIVLSTFLEGVYNMPIAEDGSVGTGTVVANKKSVTKFIFMTRHPIANLLATDIFIQEAMGGWRDFEIILRNYIQMHKYALMDAKKLDSPFMWVKLEDFTANPGETLKEIFSFLELSNDSDTIAQVLEDVGTIKPNTNEKYFEQWCMKDIKTHGKLATKYNDEIKALGLGYDMVNMCT